MKISERMFQIEDKLTEVRKHCMCLAVEETKHHYTVLYPPGFFLDGVRVGTTGEGGKLAALGKLLEYMERHWQESQL